MAELKIRKMSEIQPEPVKWLWEPYIPSGKITLIQGDGEMGKTTVSLAIAAAVSTGTALPGGLAFDAPARVIVQNAEDNLNDTIRPRLEMLGADCDMIENIDDDEEPLSLTDERMAQTGIKNKSAYIRKMCIDGHVFNLELPVFDEIKRLLSISSNNLNQLTRRVNSGGEAYREDIAELNGQLKEITMQFGEALTLLSNIADAKPGKRFIPPPTIRDLPEYAESTRAEGV